MPDAVVICPYCTQPARLVDSAHIYGRSYGLVWDCRRCDAYVGCHRGTSHPLGTLANRALRQVRLHTHHQFDQLWRRRRMTRAMAYRWMQEVMGLTADEAHIGRLSVEQCQALVGHVRGIMTRSSTEATRRGLTG